MATSGSKKKGTGAKNRNGAKKRRSPHCKRCDRAIHVPKGWGSGAATRRHYWAKHREVMERKSTS